MRALRPLRLKSLDDLELGARGKLITSLLRVQRQPRPAASEPASGGEEAAPVEANPASGPSPESEGAASAEAAAPAAEKPAAPAEDPVVAKQRGYSEVLYLVGSAWRAAGAADRAAVAFAASGREPGPEEEEPVAEPRASSAPRDGSSGARAGNRPQSEGKRERPARAARPERGARPGGESRRDRERGPRMPELTGSWEEQAKALEGHGRTRDAARLYEQHQQPAQAAQLFEKGGDLKSALRCFVAAQDNEGAKRLVAALPAAQVGPALEKAGAYELLMEHHIAQGDFESVAKLYERAKQYDQAALAYERAAKWSLARKAFERAHDSAGAQRVRGREVKALIERGDRLGAATLLVAGGQTKEALEALAETPAAKRFHFLQRLALKTEAQTLAEQELKRAEEEKKPAGRARWLELLARPEQAAEAWKEAGRLEKAVALYEQLQRWPEAAALAEQAQLREKAIELYTKSQDAEGLSRANALPVVAPASSPSPEVAVAEGEQDGSAA